MQSAINRALDRMLSFSPAPEESTTRPPLGRLGLGRLLAGCNQGSALRQSRLILCVATLFVPLDSGAQSEQGSNASELAQTLAMPRTVSQSGQITILAEDSGVRSALMSNLEQIRAQSLRLLSLADSYAFPIVVHVSTSSSAGRGSKHRLRYLRTDGGPVLRLDLVIDPSFRVEDVRRLMLQAVLMERAASAASPQPQRGFDLPIWLTEGVLASLQTTGPGQAELKDLVEVINDDDRTPTLRDVINSDPARADSVTQKLHQAASACLVQLLVRLSPDGQSFERLLAGLTDPRANQMVLLLAHFPQLGESEASAQRWWRLSVARMALQQDTNVLSATDTDRVLTELLKLSFPAVPSSRKRSDQTDEAPAEEEGKVFSIEQYVEFLRHPKRKEVCEETAGRLLMLQARAHPLLRSVIEEYGELLGLLARGRHRGVDARILELSQTREQVLARLVEIDDFLNWYLATNMTRSSDAFEGYFETIKKHRQFERVSREDEVSAYLDRLSREFD